MLILRKFKLAVLLCGASSTLAFAQPTPEVLKAYREYDAGAYVQVQAITTRCISRNYPLAVKMERDVGMHPDVYSVTKYWALSDVAECLFLRAQSYQRQNKIALARNDFENLIRYFPLARVEDRGGWVWSPAEKAKKELEVLNLHE